MMGLCSRGHMSASRPCLRCEDDAAAELRAITLPSRIRTADPDDGSTNGAGPMPEYPRIPATVGGGAMKNARAPRKGPGRRGLSGESTYPPQIGYLHHRTDKGERTP